MNKNFIIVEANSQGCFDDIDNMVFYGPYQTKKDAKDVADKMFYKLGMEGDLEDNCDISDIFQIKPLTIKI